MRDAAIEIRVEGGHYKTRYFDTGVRALPVVYVHGLGASRSDFAAIAGEDVLSHMRLLSYDQPGSGDAPYDCTKPLDVDDLTRILAGFVDQLELAKFHLAGGSMGGLVALLYAERHPSRLLSFINVEGNLAPEDCMFSRLVFGHDYDHFESIVFPDIKRALSRRSGAGFAKHLEVLARANPRAYFDYCEKLVRYSDEGRLLERFLSLPVPRAFIYGSENGHLSYLPRLRSSSCAMYEVAGANHFPFYDNPAQFASAVEQACKGGVS